jgi:hypothetical protein
MCAFAKLCEVERVGRDKPLRKIAYYTELYEWTGLKKKYANIINNKKHILLSLRFFNFLQTEQTFYS